MGRHPGFEKLLDFIENRLSETERSRVLAHVDSPCAVCRADIEAVGDILDLLRGEGLSEPPQAAVRRANQLFQRFYKRPASESRPWLIAQLRFDSWLVPTGVAARGVGNERQMLYRAEGLDVDLQVSAERDQQTVRLFGQVLPTDDDPSLVAGYPVRLTQHNQEANTTVTDELGTFSFRALSPGDYELWLDLPHASVWIPSLTLKPTWTE